MDRIEFNLLKAEFEAQIEQIDKIYEEIKEREKGAKRNKARLESLGYKLHNLYCAFEDLFKIVARHFENQIRDISKYHKEMLQRMSLAIEGVRPALISDESYRELNELRAFRHFFRHAYSYELNYEKIMISLSSAYRLKQVYKEDISRFLNIINREVVPLQV
ncbi:MAG: hypothetical protein QME42_06480 [bacterium]|nr:hypothetical protein [bacterium]